LGWNRSNPLLHLLVKASNWRTWIILLGIGVAAAATGMDETGGSAGGSRGRLEMLVGKLLWCRKKKKFAVEREKLAVVVPIAGKKMSLQGCWVIVGHGVGGLWRLKKPKFWRWRRKWKGWQLKKRLGRLTFCKLWTWIYPP